MRSLSIAAVLLLAASCTDGDDDGDDGPIHPDASADAGVADAEPDAGEADTGVDAGMTVCPGNVAPIPGGGFGGGPLDGNLFAFAVDFDDVPIAGATVLVEAGGETFTAITDASGCAELSGAALSGSAAVHMFASDYVPTSIFNMTAARATIALPRPSGATPRPSAEVTGVVTNLEVLGSTTATVAQVAFVNAIAADPFTGAPAQGTRPGSNTPSNLAVVGARFGEQRDYRLAVWTDVQHLVVFAGIAQVPQMGQTTAVYDRYGFVTNLAPLSAGEVRMNQDVTITHTGSESIDITYGNLRNLPRFAAFSMLVMPNRSGYLFPSSTNTPGPGNRVTLDNIPPLTGALEGAGYGVAVQTTSQDGTMFSLFITDDPSIVAGSTYDVGDLPEIPSSLEASGRTVTGNVDTTTNYLLADLSSGSTLLWSIIELDRSGRTFALTLPRPPEGYPDPLGGDLLLRIFASEYVEVDFDDISFEEVNLNTLTRRSARAQATITFF